MPDFHHNIFYYYRGASLSDTARERQLEDNTTKALVNVIEHCDLNVSKAFLDWLGIEVCDKPICELQRTNISCGSIKRKSIRILLGLIPSKASHSSNNTSPARSDSRPDAWIYGNDYVILIESKIVGGLDRHQIHRHQAILQTKEDPIVKTWPQIHHFFKTLNVNLSSKDAWIIYQFIKYLEFNSMGGFTGFDAEIFDFFLSQGDVDTKKWFREYMHIFAEAVSVELKRLDTFYEHYDLGNIKASSKNCWIAFGPSGSEYRKYAHLSVSIDPMGVSVFVNVETQHAVKKLKECISQKKQLFLDTIFNLPCLDICSIEVMERSQVRVSLYEYTQAIIINGSILRDATLRTKSFDYLESVISSITYPEFIVRVVLPRKDAISRREGILTDIIGIATDLNTLVALINR